MLLVDAANVIGSRPTGWWKDRASAARTFVHQMRAAVESGRIHPPVTIVLEGKARDGVRDGFTGEIRVLHATASGDDLILDVLREVSDPEVILVTADRELGRLAEGRGANVVKPGWLLGLLE